MKSDVNHLSEFDLSFIVVESSCSWLMFLKHLSVIFDFDEQNTIWSLYLILYLSVNFELKIIRV